jgi:hypothetical protein
VEKRLAAVIFSRCCQSRYFISIRHFQRTNHVKTRGTLARRDEYAGYRVDSFVMAKISSISLDSISCGGFSSGARTTRLAITRLDTHLGTVALSKRITKTISLKTITFS